jgi:ParB family chromosome partitioning protein
MSKRRQDEQQAQAIRERLAQRKAAAPPPPPVPAEPSAEAADAPDREAQARSHFLGPQLGTLVSDRAIEAIPLPQITPELRPGLRQPRMVPLPDQLVVNGETPPEYIELVAELRDLGESLRERQIQPIVVYPGTSEDFPTVRYLILVGQRRWTAAQLVGMSTIDAIVVEPPAPLDRIALQFAENETREDFSDIERAWTLQQLREAMGGEQVGVPEVAARLNLKRSRAYQLLRMLAFPPEQQQTIALLRLQERQLLPLIDAYHQAQVTPEGTGTVLQRLQQIAAERSLGSHQLADQETTRSVEAPRRSGIDAATVARLVARVAQDTTLGRAASSDPRWYSVLLNDVESVARKLRRAADRVDELGPDKAAELRGRIQELQRQTQQLADQLEPARLRDS